MTGKKDTFINYWLLYSKKSRHKGEPLPHGLVSKTGVAHVVQRCVPQASDQDLQYVFLLLEAMLSELSAIHIKDMAHAIKQGSIIEKLVERSQLPKSIRKVLSTIAEEFQGQGHRAKKIFTSLDWTNSG